MKTEFGLRSDGRMAYQYTIRSEALTAVLSDHGATLLKLFVPDSQGNLADVVLGFDNPGAYTESGTFFGATVGRNSNRVGGAAFPMNGKTYRLDPNDNGVNNLHGGFDPYKNRLWDVASHSEKSITFTLQSPNGDQGFPGNAQISVTYTLFGRDLRIRYEAVSDMDTVFNMTNHTYFNLDGAGDIKNHKLKLNSHYYMTVRDDGLATGRVLPVEGTEFDFLEEKVIGPAIEKAAAAQPTVAGIDHHFFCDAARSEYRHFGTLTASDDSLKMDIYTNQCGVQIYTGNFVPQMTAYGRQAFPYCALTMETQAAPNSMNNSHLPSILLHRGERYYHKTGFRFYY